MAWREVTRTDVLGKSNVQNHAMAGLHGCSLAAAPVGRSPLQQHHQPKWGVRAGNTMREQPPEPSGGVHAVELCGQHLRPARLALRRRRTIPRTTAPQRPATPVLATRRCRRSSPRLLYSASTRLPAQPSGSSGQLRVAPHPVPHRVFYAMFAHGAAPHSPKALTYPVRQACSWALYNAKLKERISKRSLKCSSGPRSRSK